ncbi:LysR substrate-binding domain-containing protein [Aureimonas sp. AU4]|uniref:LysR substrate-binding domain-containing protein n=1 Tax=Aureimonas sp. AU4 TaxID=1638163 RepID=UPI000781D510|nr:LysR substrate-binding domain-containing protein [Aureimonas sp. AU4]
MTLDQLRVFVAVAEREHVTEAAKALNLTQSATSAAIAALEERHDVRLFDRVGRRIELTEAGRLFLPEARAVLARAEDAGIVLAELAGLKRGRLRIVASQTVANHWLPPMLARFKVRHPGIDLRLSIANTARTADAVLDATADLGFVEDELGDIRLAMQRVADDRLMLAAASGHVGCGSPVAAADLASARWVLRERGSGTRAILEGALEAFGVDPTALSVELELPSNEAVRAAIEAGAGLGILPAVVAEAGLRTGTLVALPFDLPSRGFHAVLARDRHRSRAVAAFLAELPAVEVPPA